MTEATHLAEGMFNLESATGRGGGRLFAGYLQIDDTETIDTGMSFVHALVTCFVENFANDTTFANPTTVATTGSVTMSVAAWDDGAADTGGLFYVMAAGVSYP